RTCGFLSVMVRFVLDYSRPERSGGEGNPWHARETGSPSRSFGLPGMTVASAPENKMAGTSPAMNVRSEILRPGAFAELLLVGVDGGGLLHGQPDAVEAVEQAVLAERVDVERDHAAVRAADLLLLEVDG